MDFAAICQNQSLKKIFLLGLWPSHGGVKGLVWRIALKFETELAYVLRSTALLLRHCVKIMRLIGLIFPDVAMPAS